MEKLGYLIAKTLDSFNKCFTKFSSKIGNLYIKFCIFFKNLIIAPYLFYYFCPRNASALPFQKIFYYLKFFEGYFDFFITPKYFFLISIETNIFMFQGIFCGDSLHNSVNSRIKLFEIKRFYNIIIRTTSKSFQLIIKFSLCGSHNNRGTTLGFSNGFA